MRRIKLNKMATFEQAFTHIKSGGYAKREITKNQTAIREYKNRLYHDVLGVRAAYVPTNADLFADDWILIK